MRLFDSLADARQKLAIWRYDYNNVRPHSSLGNRSLHMRVGHDGLILHEGSTRLFRLRTVIFNPKTLVMIEGLPGGRSPPAHRSHHSLFHYQ